MTTTQISGRIQSCGPSSVKQPLPPAETEASMRQFSLPAQSRPRDVTCLRGPVDDPDGWWVTRAKEGEIGAFEELIARHRQRVYLRLLAMVGNVEEAQDAL